MPRAELTAFIWSMRCSDNVSAAVVSDAEFSRHWSVVSGQRDVSSWTATQQLSDVDTDHVQQSRSLEPARTRLHRYSRVQSVLAGK